MKLNAAESPSSAKGINDLEVTGGIGKSYFARVIGKGIRLELIKTRSES